MSSIERLRGMYSWILNPTFCPQAEVYTMTSQVYRVAEARGRRLFALLERRLNDNGVHDVTAPNIDTSYRVESFDADVDLTGGLTTGLLSQNIRTDGWTFTSVSDRINSEAAYSNYFSCEQGSIICLYNDKTKDHTSQQERLQWSEMVFQVYQMQAAREHQPVREMKTIWRYWIANADTQKILGEAKAHGGPRDDGLGYLEYRPGNDAVDSGFFALLGCPNGNGIVRLLIDHSDALGSRTIESIRVLTGTNHESPPTIYFVLAPYNPPPVMRVKRSIAGQERMAKRHQKEHPGNQQGFPSLGSA